MFPSSSRRSFLAAGGASALWAISPGMPAMLARAAALASRKEDDRILVVVQLSGGNDGLNTVIPFENDIYHRERTTLRIAKESVRKLNDQLGFHPALAAWEKPFREGRITIVQGVGYPQPNRSHFESMDIWHTGRTKDEGQSHGWVGRIADRLPQGEGAIPAIHLGDEPQPLAIAGDGARAVSIRNLEGFQLRSASELRPVIEAFPSAEKQNEADGDLLDFVRASSSSALAASRRLEKAMADAKSGKGGAYPDSKLSEKLRQIALLIGAGIGTRVYYVALDGFDTHSQQAGAHAALLRELSEGVAAFLADLERLGALDRTLLVAFSEFGRRVKENASQGTDHGAAGPMFLAGGRVKGGILGNHPSLTDLDDGDLKHAADFRQVYATILDKHLAIPSDTILGKRFATLPLFA